MLVCSWTQLCEHDGLLQLPTHPWRQCWRAIFFFISHVTLWRKKLGFLRSQKPHVLVFITANVYNDCNMLDSFYLLNHINSVWLPTCCTQLFTCINSVHFIVPFHFKLIQCMFVLLQIPIVVIIIVVDNFNPKKICGRLCRGGTSTRDYIIYHQWRAVSSLQGWVEW